MLTFFSRRAQREGKKRQHFTPSVFMFGFRQPGEHAEAPCVAARLRVRMDPQQHKCTGTTDAICDRLFWVTFFISSKSQVKVWLYQNCFIKCPTNDCDLLLAMPFLVQCVKLNFWKNEIFEKNESLVQIEIESKCKELKK